MTLFLHTPSTAAELDKVYALAFQRATSLFVVSAYLTDWSETLVLNRSCKHFRLIVGCDFGITRKAACRKALKWLPPHWKARFLVVDGIRGFHPKGVFWQEENGRCRALISSSNLTKAAFETNFEANVLVDITDAEFRLVQEWIKAIEVHAQVLNESWLNQYIEGERPTPTAESAAPPELHGMDIWALPNPSDAAALVSRRRQQLQRYSDGKSALIGLFRACADGRVDNQGFFERLPEVWSARLGNRLQGDGWERRGKASDFRTLSHSFLRIHDADPIRRDDVVSDELDHLQLKGVETRKAFLSEMLCLAFPHDYPLYNKPVKAYLDAVGFKSYRGATEGARYLDFSRRMRLALTRNPGHAAKNLAELDYVIWGVYGRNADSSVQQ